MHPLAYRLLPIAIATCLTFGGTIAQARQYPISLDGEVAGSLARRSNYLLSNNPNDMQLQFLSGGTGAAGVGAGASFYIGLADAQESTNVSLKNVELGLSYRTLGSFTGTSADGAQHSGKLTQYMIAPGVRYRYTGFLVQPMFTLHAGWFPTAINVAGSNALSENFLGTFGLQASAGVQFNLASRVGLGVGAGMLPLWVSITDSVNRKSDLRFFVRWRAFVTLTVVGGNP